MSDEADIRGKGSEILLPSRGNPFKKGGPADEPKDLNPAELSAQFDGAEVDASAGMPALAEPADLSPAEVAALFPASADERNLIPVAAAPQDHVSDLDGTLPPSLSDDEVAALLADGLAGTLSADPAPARPAARARYETLVATARARDGEPRVDISAFDPDAAIGRPRTTARAARTVGKVDLAAFDPDAPVGTSSTLVHDRAGTVEDRPVGEPADASSIKADVVAVDASVTLAELSPMSSPSDSPSALPPAGEIASGSSAAPNPGFKPFDPFAPASDAGAAAPVEPAATAVAAVAAVTPAAGEGAVAVVSATAVAAPASDILSESLSRHDSLSARAITHVPEEDSMLSMLVTDSRIDQLWDRIEAAERAAVADMASLRDRRFDNLENLKIARNLLLGGRKNYEDAVRYLVEVEADMLYAQRVRKWTSTWGMAIFAYNLIWLGLLFLGYFMAGRIVEPFAASGTLTREFGFVLWVSILTGGLGGVSKSLFSLVTHTTRQDFDTQHNLWYWTCPLIGAVLGIFVIFTSQIGLTGLGADVGKNSTASLFAYALSWVVGFQQNLVLELVERVKKILIPDKKKGQLETPPGE
jgi:hypothetical protein